MTEILTILESELIARRVDLSTAVSRCTQKRNVLISLKTNGLSRFFDLMSIESDTDYESVFNERSTSEVALMISPAHTNLYLGFDEKWKQIVPHKKTREVQKYEFDGLHIRFYLGTQTGAIRQFARYEWEPMRKKPSSMWSDEEVAEFTYDGKGAAHPHFHLDALQVDFKKKSFTPISSEPYVSTDSAQFNIEEDLISAGWLQHLHIPLKALWELPTQTHHSEWHASDASQALPHQHQPQSLTELNNWFEWVVNYTIHQFEINSSRS
jgi:hypothetical protein